jgi:hypothetical protein
VAVVVEVVVVLPVEAVAVLVEVPEEEPRWSLNHTDMKESSSLEARKTCWSPRT